MKNNNVFKYRSGSRAVTVIVTIVTLLAVLFVSTYLCYHSVAVFDDLYMTGVIGKASTKVYAELEVALFRDDEVIELDGARDGNIRYMFSNGAKVGYECEAARVYTDIRMTDGENVELIARMREIESEIEHIDELLDLRHTTYYSVASRVQNSYKSFISVLGTGDPQDAVLASGVLASELNRYDAVKNGKSELENTKNALEAEYESLSEKYYGNYYSVLTKKSGYFFDRSEIDGYEKAFSTDLLGSINADTLRAMMKSDPSEISEDAVGKMTYSYDWHIAAVADDDLCRRLEVGLQYSITFEDSGEELVFTLERIASVINGEGVLIFKCSTMPQGFDYSRISTVMLETGEIEGLSVPSSAVYDENGIKCIYTLKRGKLIKKKAEILYENNGMCIIAEGVSDGDDADDGGLPYPTFNDVIIISGNDLYDGKVLG